MKKEEIEEMEERKSFYIIHPGSEPEVKWSINKKEIFEERITELESKVDVLNKSSSLMLDVLEKSNRLIDILEKRVNLLSERLT